MNENVNDASSGDQTTC